MVGAFGSIQKKSEKGLSPYEGMTGGGIGLVNPIIIIFCLIGIPLSITFGIKSLRAYDRTESMISLIEFVCLTFVVPIFLFLLLLWTLGDTPGV